ncbi:kinase-like domain-containing protein [Sporodiniella umbellata]|nr:kinase-like domain-containing protein [Sporodiniella umbellata]
MSRSQFLNTFIDNNSLQLISILGSSTYGVVYLGQEVRTSRQYAVKCVKDNRFSENEAFIHSLLSGNQYILSLEKIVKEKNHIFLVMEYATNGDLFSNLIKSSDIIGNPRMIRHLFLQILDAVQHCHNHLIAHRDLKPENIMLLSNHRVKVADFGLSTFDTVSSEFNCGSIYYLSPECQGISFSNQTVTFYDSMATDIWSLGIILINLVTGRNPWKRAYMKDLAFVSYVQSPETFFQDIFPGISTRFERVLRGCLSLDPKERMSLNELRSAVLRCKSFLKAKPETLSLITPPPSLPTSQPITSISKTMLAYIGDYTDEDFF